MKRNHHYACSIPNDEDVICCCPPGWPRRGKKVNLRRRRGHQVRANRRLLQELMEASAHA